LEAVEWEYKETDRVSGRERRKRYGVQMYCEPETIVSRGESAQAGDFVYEGPPTPSMEPLDAEARAITNEHKASWNHPIESLPGQGFSASLLGALEAQVQEAIRNPKAPPLGVGGVSKEEFELLKEQLAELMAKNAELVSTKKAEISARRKV
jgi:hypothetical protein